MSKKSLDWDGWVALYDPVKNHIDDNASYDGFGFETYGLELDFVKSVPVANIWTVIDGDDGIYVTSGFHLVNRLLYLVTEQPCPDDKLIEFMDVDYSEIEE